MLIIVLALQLAFWLLFTHLKSRFLLPAVVPLALGTGLGGAVLGTHFAAQFSRIPNIGRASLALAGLAFAVAWCSVPVVVFAGEPRSDDPAPAARVGRIDYITGAAFPKHDRAQLAAVSHIIAINELPADARTLLIGEAAPFYLSGHITSQTTWDRGPMSQVIADHSDDPRAWIEALRAMGFTHLFINPSMLQRWERAGWNDPLLTADRVMSAAEQFAQRVQVTPTGVLYRLR